MRRRNKGLPSGLAAQDVALCGFTLEGTGFAPGVYVSRGAFYGASWYGKGADFDAKPASSSGFFAPSYGETRARTSEGPVMKRLLWVRREAKRTALNVLRPKEMKHRFTSLF